MKSVKMLQPGGLKGRALLDFSFLCARCKNGRSLTGRRKRKVRGLSEYVCAGCVREIDAKSTPVV